MRQSTLILCPFTNNLSPKTYLQLLITITAISRVSLWISPFPSSPVPLSSVTVLSLLGLHHQQHNYTTASPVPRTACTSAALEFGQDAVR